MPQIQVLKIASELDEVLATSQETPVLLFKHSVTCPISARAQEAFVQVFSAPRYALVVQYAADVSAAVAEKLGVEHASPQVIGIDKGRATFMLSHGEITVEALEHALAEDK